MMRSLSYGGLADFPARDAQFGPESVLTQDAGTLHEQRFLDAQDDLFGEKRLARIGGRADGVAAPALGAGIAIEQLLPRELFRFGDAVVLALLDIFHEWQRTFGAV